MQQATAVDAYRPVLVVPACCFSNLAVKWHLSNGVASSCQILPAEPNAFHPSQSGLNAPWMPRLFGVPPSFQDRDNVERLFAFGADQYPLA